MTTMVIDGDDIIVDRLDNTRCQRYLIHMRKKCHADSPSLLSRLL